MKPDNRLVRFLAQSSEDYGAHFSYPWASPRVASRHSNYTSRPRACWNGRRSANSNARPLPPREGAFRVPRAAARPPRIGVALKLENLSQGMFGKLLDRRPHRGIVASEQFILDCDCGAMPEGRVPHLGLMGAQAALNLCLDPTCSLKFLPAQHLPIGRASIAVSVEAFPPSGW